ncbi:MAG: hypothetical protein ABEK42_13805 [Thiohalorhabdaceae bacterium]
MFLDRTSFRDCNPATLSMFRVPDVATFATLHPAISRPLTNRMAGLVMKQPPITSIRP